MIRVVAYFLTKPILKTGNYAKVSGILTEKPKITFKNAQFKLNDQLIVFPLSQNVKTKFNADDWMFKRITVTGKYICRGGVAPPKGAGTSPLQITKDNLRVCEISADKVVITSTSFLTRILLFFAATRAAVINVCFKILPAEEAGILIGILLGDSTHVSHNMYETFKKTGTLHLFAASGMNLVLFGGFFREALLIFMKRKKAELLTVFSCIFYVFLSGFQPSILRAGAMFAATGITSVAGRPLKSSLSLMYAAGILVFISPSLISNLGFQLSVLSTLGLIVNPAGIQACPRESGKLLDSGWSLPRTQMRGRNDKRYILPGVQMIFPVISSLWKMLAADLQTSFSCFLFTAPLLIFTFGQINFLSIIVNLTVLWTIDILMLGGMVVVLLYFIGLRIETIFTLLLFPVIVYFKSMILYFSKFNLGVINLNYPDKTISVIIFCLILWIAFILKTEEKASCQNNLYIEKHQ